MDKTLRTAATGLSAQQNYVEIISNNIANVNTTGFKKVRPEFQDLLYETLRPAGNFGRAGVEPLNEVQIGSGTEMVASKKIFTQGSLTNTNNPLDMMINGEGFYIVRRPDDTFAYTRDGSFRLDANGDLVTAQGYRLEPGFNVPDEAVEVTISRDGIVSVLMEDSTSHQTLGQIEIAKFINSAGLRNLGDNVYVETPASGQPIFNYPGENNTGEIHQYYLETSNVDVVEEMVNMITAQRAYELNSKSVQTADTILSTAVNLKR
jgi:flagellar basal-body rod protein FlgG